jgi:hypothetical protein
MVETNSSLNSSLLSRLSRLVLPTADSPRRTTARRTGQVMGRRTAGGQHLLLPTSQAALMLASPIALTRQFDSCRPFQVLSCTHRHVHYAYLSSGVTRRCFSNLYRHKRRAWV